MGPSQEDTMDLVQEQLERDIEKLFAEATSENLRQTSRQLETLVRKLSDPRIRAQYEAAIDQLSDMVKHTVDKD
jgi:cell division protein FtsB